MKLEVTNKNYCATIVSLDKIIPHPNADRLEIALIFANQVIISKDTPVGEIGIYFPVECKISHEYLKHNNLYRDKTVNRDTSKAGFFEANGRVRAVKLRSVPSAGFFMPLNSLDGLINQDEINKFKIGDEFNKINDNLVCEKYVIQTRNSGEGNAKNQKKGNKKKKESKIIENMWHFHIDTAHLKKEMFKLSPNDLVELSTKIHGSSFISGKVLCKKPLNFFERVLKMLGANIVDTHYDYLYSSRRVIKNDLLKPELHYYDEDIWGKVHEKVQPFLKNGMTVYGEVYGQFENGKWIQKNYDYGCPANTWDFMVYRITTTDNEGNVFEWSTRQVRDFCKKNSLKAVPELYYGTLANWLNERNVSWDERNFHDVCLNELMKEYLEKDSVLCNNKVPEEGIVLRRESSDIEVWKLKAFKFLQSETEELDKGETNIEDEQSQE